MVPGVNIISGKVSVASVNGTGASGGAVRPSAGVLRKNFTLSKASWLT